MASLANTQQYKTIVEYEIKSDIPPSPWLHPCILTTIEGQMPIGPPKIPLIPTILLQLSSTIGVGLDY
jgi:hypothetical protein